MSASIRGHMGQFKIFRDGQLSAIVDITNVDLNQDSSFSRTAYVGRRFREGDQSIDGWSGSIDCEVKDASVDEFIDALTNANLNGIGVSDYTFIETENYPDGTSKSWVHFDCQFKMSKKIPGGDQKITKRLDFQSAGRQAL